MGEQAVPAQADAAARDTERLDWLESKGSIEIECTVAYTGRDIYAVGRDQIDDNQFHESLRAAIDAAMEAIRNS